MFKTLTISTAIAALSAAAFAPISNAQEIVDGPEVRWNHSLWGNPRAFSAGVEELSKLLDERTGGKFKLKVHYGAALSKGRENLDGIKLGAFQSANFCDFYHPGKNPSFMVFSLPFLPIEDSETMIRVRDRLFEHPALVKDMDNWDAMVYASALLPLYEFMGVGEPPKSLEDWSGLRVRAGGGLGEAMEQLGATRMTLPAPEVYTSLQRGAIDAVSFGFTYAFGAYKIDEVASWYTNGFTIGSFECPIVFNKTAWSGLPEQYRKLILDLKPEVYEAQLTAYREIDKKNVPVFKEKLEEISYSPEQIAEFKKLAGQPVWEEWVAENSDKFDAQGVLDLLLETAGNKSE